MNEQAHSTPQRTESPKRPIRVIMPPPKTPERSPDRMLMRRVVPPRGDKQSNIQRHSCIITQSPVRSSTLSSPAPKRPPPPPPQAQRSNSEIPIEALAAIGPPRMRSM